MVSSQGASWSHHTQVKGVILPSYLALVFHKPRPSPSAVPHATILAGWLVTPWKVHLILIIVVFTRQNIFMWESSFGHSLNSTHWRNPMHCDAKLLSVISYYGHFAARFFLPVHILTKVPSGQLLHWATSSVQCAHMDHICCTIFLCIGLYL